MSKNTEFVVTRNSSEGKGVLGGILRAATGTVCQTLSVGGLDTFHVKIPTWKAEIFETQATMNGYCVHTHP